MNLPALKLPRELVSGLLGIRPHCESITLKRKIAGSTVSKICHFDPLV
jgi:hypothetical protein